MWACTKSSRHRCLHQSGAQAAYLRLNPTQSKTVVTGASPYLTLILFLWHAFMWKPKQRAVQFEGEAQRLHHAVIVAVETACLHVCGVQVLSRFTATTPPSNGQGRDWPLKAAWIQSELGYSFKIFVWVWSNLSDTIRHGSAIHPSLQAPRSGCV